MQVKGENGTTYPVDDEYFWKNAFYDSAIVEVSYDVQATPITRTAEIYLDSNLEFSY